MDPRHPVGREVNPRVVVIGAGLSGAAASRRLVEAGLSPVVLEADGEIGGRARTVRERGNSIDSGAIFVMGSYARTRRFIREAGHKSRVAPWHARTALLENGRLHHVRFDRPSSFLRLPQLTWRDRWRLARTVIGLSLRSGPAPFDLESLAADDDGETMEQWSRRVLGDRVHEYMVRPLMEPLTGADLNTISRSFLKGLLRRAHQTSLYVPDGGLDRIASWLLEDVDVQLGVHVKRMSRSRDGLLLETSAGDLEADLVIVATDPWTAADLTEGLTVPAVSESLRQVAGIPLHHVAFEYAEDPWATYPADLVVPVGAGDHTDIGVLLNSRRSKGSSGPGQVVSVYFDGPHSVSTSDTDLVDRARRVMSSVLGDREPDHVHVFAHSYGLSTPAPGHYSRMITVLEQLPEDVCLAGDYLTHSGIESAIIAGEAAADSALGKLSRIGGARL